MGDLAHSSAQQLIHLHRRTPVLPKTVCWEILAVRQHHLIFELALNLAILFLLTSLLLFLALQPFPLQLLLGLRNALQWAPSKSFDHFGRPFLAFARHKHTFFPLFLTAFALFLTTLAVAGVKGVASSFGKLLFVKRVLLQILNLSLKQLDIRFPPSVLIDFGMRGELLYLEE